jgi:hypothetical protein
MTSKRTEDAATPFPSCSMQLRVAEEGAAPSR